MGRVWELVLVEGQEHRGSVPWLGVDTLTWPSGSRGLHSVHLPCLTFDGRYVAGMLDLHDKTDADVRDDYELQSWCHEITEVGLQGAQDRGNRSPWPEN